MDTLRRVLDSQRVKKLHNVLDSESALRDLNVGKFNDGPRESRASEDWVIAVCFCTPQYLQI